VIGTVRRSHRWAPSRAAGGTAAALAALLFGAGVASAQQGAAPADSSTRSAEAPIQARAALERGGVPGFQAVTDLAGVLEERIRADTRALVEARGTAEASVSDVTLRMRLDPELADRESSVRMESVRIEMGRAFELRPSQLRALERGEVVTAYSGVLPSAIGVVRVKAEGSVAGAPRRLDRAFRLAMASDDHASIRIEVIADQEKNTWMLRPVLERERSP
jgi:hypothetical protein